MDTVNFINVYEQVYVGSIIYYFCEFHFENGLTTNEICQKKKQMILDLSYDLNSLKKCFVTSIL